MMAGKRKPEENPENPYLKMPTFPEYVDFLLWAKKAKKFHDAHTSPATNFANICFYEYDYVVKLENEAYEIPYLLQQLNLTRFSDSLFNKKTNPSGVAHVANEEVYIHLSQVSLEKQKELNQLYKLDYAVLGYEPMYALDGKPVTL